MATRRISTPSSRAGGRRSQSAAASPTTPEPTSAGAGRYRRTAWAFLILALAAVTGLREWFGVSGAAGTLLHHIAAGPLGLLGVTVPVLLGALGVAMLRVHRLAPVHARVAVGCLGVLTGVTGIIQIARGNPPLSRGISAIEEAGGLLGWVVGYPLALLFSAVGGIILFLLLIAFALLVLTGMTVADLRERMSGAAGKGTGDTDEDETDSLALRLLDRMRSRREKEPASSLDSYDGDDPFRSALQTEENEAPTRRRGSGRRARAAAGEAPTRQLGPRAQDEDAAGQEVFDLDLQDAAATSVLGAGKAAFHPVSGAASSAEAEADAPPTVALRRRPSRQGRPEATTPLDERPVPPTEPDAVTQETPLAAPAQTEPETADPLDMGAGLELPDGTVYSLPTDDLLEPGPGHATRTEANDAIVDKLQGVFTEFGVDATVTGYTLSLIHI